MPIPAILVALGTAVTITLTAFGPAYRAAKDLPVQRKESGVALNLAMQKAASEGKFKNYIRRIDTKPFSGILGYYQIKHRNGTHFFVIYENGTLAEKAGGSDWVRHISPESLNKFYSMLRSSLETTPSYKQKGITEYLDSELERLLE
jgi:hypothetical protein